MKSFMSNLGRSWAIGKAVGWVTFLEIIRDKILYNIILCSFLLFGVGFLASRLTASQPERVILDFGLAAVRISCSVIGIFIGSGLLVREFDRRTIHLALCRPVSRGQFLFGKFMGLGGVLILNWILLSSAYISILVSSSSGEVSVFSWTLVSALVLGLIQSLMISSIAILFSAFSTTSLSVIISIGFYLIGNTISQLKFLADRMHSPLQSAVIHFVATLLPNLEYFNLGTKVTYHFSVSGAWLSLSLLYGFFMIVLLLIIAGFLVRIREV